MVAALTGPALPARPGAGVAAQTPLTAPSGCGKIRLMGAAASGRKDAGAVDPALFWRGAFPNRANTRQINHCLFNQFTICLLKEYLSIILSIFQRHLGRGGMTLTRLPNQEGRKSFRRSWTTSTTGMRRDGSLCQPRAIDRPHQRAHTPPGPTFHARRLDRRRQSMFSGFSHLLSILPAWRGRP